jgi:hypothetical protein
MTDAVPATRCAEQAAWRLEDIAGHLAVAGLNARLHYTRHSTYLTAASHADSHRDQIEAVVDDDSYAELRFWIPGDADPAQAASVITAAVAAIAAARP